MFCQNCRTQLPDDASFCWKCGKPQKASVPSNEIKYEYCDVDAELQGENVLGCLLGMLEFLLHGRDRGNTFRFVATVIGPTGRNRPYFTRKFTYPGGLPDENKNTAAHLNGLINQLVKDGWEPAETHGDKWYKYRFRRRIR